MADPSTPPAAFTPRPILATMQVPMVYLNGFNAALSNSDTACILMYDSQPVIKAVMPLSVAKSLSRALSELISQYEGATSTKVLSIEELVPLLSKSK